MIRNFSLAIFIFGIVLSGFSQTKIDSLQQQLIEAKQDELKLKLLDTLSHQMIKEKHPEQFKYLEDVIQLAKKLGDFDLAASKTRFIAQKYIYGGKADSAIYVVEQMLKHKEKFTTEKSEGHLLLKRAGAYFNQELLEKAAKDYDKSGDLFLISGDSIFAADARYFAGQVYVNLKDFLTSLERYEESYKLYAILGDKLYANYALSELASIYGRNKFYDKAIFERKKVLKELLKGKEYKGISTIYIQLAGNYLSKKEFETAKRYVDSALYYADSISHPVVKSRIKIHAEVGKLKYYLNKNDIIKAKKHLDLANEQRFLTDAPEYYNSVMLLPKAQYYKKVGNYSKAIEILNEFVAKKEKVNDISNYIQAERELAELYLLKKEYIKGAQHQQKYIEANEAFEDEVRTNRFLYYQSQFESERKDNEIYKKETQISLLEKDQEIEKSKRNMLWLLLLSIVIISITVSYYIWLLGKQKRKALDKKIAKNKKELAEFTQLLLEKSKTQESLSEEIQKLKEEIGAQKSIDKLQDLTTNKILTNDDWYTFKEKFKNVYPSFFLKIKSKGFDLTKSEERLIAMEKLYLDTNEIASMLAISQDSVVRSRSRLRKKINAPKGHSLLEFLEAS
ncbi:conserved protein of unknown function [Tenacibaculum sp. 190130A14a]|uniref:HTH luxR-type domain-containing protein n=1 Tax=Tenacibaculum polynesiense TaxID=3137857 RepID=A0ABP1F2M5_9FLAO